MPGRPRISSSANKNTATQCRGVGKQTLQIDPDVQVAQKQRGQYSDSRHDEQVAERYRRHQIAPKKPVIFIRWLARSAL